MAIAEALGRNRLWNTPRRVRTPFKCCQERRLFPLKELVPEEGERGEAMGGMCIMDREAVGVEQAKK